MEYLLPVLIALITSIFGPVAVEKVKARYNKKSKDLLGEAIDLNKIVDSKFNPIACHNVISGKLNIIGINQFHNSIKG